MMESQSPPQAVRTASANLPPLRRLIKQYLLALLVLPALNVGLILALGPLVSSQPNFPLYSALLPMLMFVYYGLPGKQARTRLYTGLTMIPLGVALSVLWALDTSLSSASVASALVAGIAAGGSFALASLWADGRDSFIGCWSTFAAIMALPVAPLALSPAPLGIRFLAAGGGLILYMGVIALVRIPRKDYDVGSPYAESFEQSSDEHPAGGER